jgi:putative transposase
MEKDRFTDQQVAHALRQAEQGTSPVEVCRKLGVSEATLYTRKQRYSSMGVAELRQVRQLADDNRRSNRRWPTSRSTNTCSRRCCQKKA